MRRRPIVIAFIKGHRPVFFLYAYLFLNFSNLELQHPGFNLIAPSLPVMSGPSPQRRWVISLAKYPASWSLVMSFSLTEETIHLPCPPDPDMAGVLF